MLNNVCRKMKSNSQSAEIFRIGSAFGLWKSSKSFANLIAFLICIFFSANTRAQTIPIPNITLTNTPICGENANLTASLPGGAAVPTDFVYQWFSDADCTLEITDARSGSYNENLTLPISSTTTVYCRLRKTSTVTEKKTSRTQVHNRHIPFLRAILRLHSKFGVHRVEIVPDVRVAKVDIQLEHYQRHLEYQVFMFMLVDKEVVDQTLAV